jgi:hypothetical protein
VWSQFVWLRHARLVGESNTGGKLSLAAIPPVFPNTGILSFTASTNLLTTIFICKSIDTGVLSYDKHRICLLVFRKFTLAFLLPLTNFSCASNVIVCQSASTDSEKNAADPITLDVV